MLLNVAFSELKMKKGKVVLTNRGSIDIITENAHDLSKGAGKIFVYNVDEVYRIRTGERDADALR